MNDEREMVLRMLKEGKISVEEADALLQALAEETETPAPEPGAGPDRSGPDIRVELGELVRELTESIPKEVINELKELRHLKDLRRLKDVGEFRRHFRSGWRGIVSALQGLSEGQAEEASELPMASGEHLEIRNAWGDITLSRSPDGQVRVRARKRVWAATAADAARDVEALSVRPRREGATVYVVSTPRVEGRVRIDMDIQVPDGVVIALDLAKGDVRADGVRADFGTHLSRGDVQVTDHAGAISLAVASGDCTVRHLDGDLRLDVKSGDIDARTVRGTVSGRVFNGDVEVLETQGVTLDVLNGDVSVKQVTGDVEIEAKNGDIEVDTVRTTAVRARALSGDVQITVPAFSDHGTIGGETMRGDVALRIPPDIRATVDASTMSGEITCALPLQDRATDRGTLGRRTLRGVLNSPGATVTLRSTSGDIDIRGIDR